MRSRIQAPVVDYINKMLLYLLEDLCEKVYNEPNSIEFRDSENREDPLADPAVSGL